MDSTWAIIAVSAAKLKGLYFNNKIHLSWLLLKNTIIPENSNWLCSWFSELWRKRTSTWFQYCSCDLIWALFPFKKCHCAFHVEKSKPLKWNILRTWRGIYKQSMVFVLFLLALSPQTNLLSGWTFPLSSFKFDDIILTLRIGYLGYLLEKFISGQPMISLLLMITTKCSS